MIRLEGMCIRRRVGLSKVVVDTRACGLVVAQTGESSSAKRGRGHSGDSGVGTNVCKHGIRLSMSVELPACRHNLHGGRVAWRCKHRVSEEDPSSGDAKLT